MNLLAGTCYDPGSAVTEATSTGTGMAMLAMDTTNLRLTFTVPPSGFVRVRMKGVVHGATTFPSILLGIMSGAGVVMRQAPTQNLGNTAVATAMVAIETDFIVGSLTAGEAKTWDAAYSLETSVASTGIKYGGPNNTVSNDAFGGFSYEIWDPCPFYTPASGVPPTSPQIAYTSGIKTKTDFLPSATAGAAGGLQIAGANAATVYASITCSGAFCISGVSTLAQTGDSFVRIGVAGSGLTAIDLPNQTMDITGNITGNLSGSVGSVSGAVGSVTGNVGGNVLGVVASVSGAVGSVTGNVGGNLLGVVASVSGLTVANLDATVSSRLATAGYTAPDNASIATILTEVSGLSVTDITAIKAKTDSLTFTVAGQVDSNPQSINDKALTGDGSVATPWGPA